MHITQYDVRLQLTDLRDRRLSTFGLTNDLHVGLIRKNQAHSRPNKSVIIDQKNPDGHIM
ncbi:hypothetical protein XaFJ1_GM001605 [Xanthomonas albilineans]|nr:hypothetical protein XaFJ1_GM001605 [Xanthomonas albilineans]